MNESNLMDGFFINLNFVCTFIGKITNFFYIYIKLAIPQLNPQRGFALKIKRSRSSTGYLPAGRQGATVFYGFCLCSKK